MLLPNTKRNGIVHYTTTPQSTLLHQQEKINKEHRWFTQKQPQPLKKQFVAINMR